MLESYVFELVETGEVCIDGLTLDDLIKIAKEAEVNPEKLNIDEDDGSAYMWMHMGRVVY